MGESGFDPVYGARPLKRAIQKLVQDPLSLELLSGNFKDGDVILSKLSPHGDVEFTKVIPN